MCPRCKSKYLMIKESEGFERLLILLTGGRRKYNCCDCDLTFRQWDRRAVKREELGPDTPRAEGSVLVSEGQGAESRNLNQPTEEISLKLKELESRLNNLQEFCVATKEGCACERKDQASKSGT
jgi:hypothetical protein